MEVTAILKARALVFIELDELNLNGKIRFSDCITPLVHQYGFTVFPQKPEEFDLSNKGVLFQSGKAGELTIDSLKIYDGAILVDTFASTVESERVLLEMLEWGKESLGLTYSPEKIRRKGYISQVLFRTDFSLLASFSPPAQRLAEKTSAFTEEIFSGLRYQNLALAIGHDPMRRKHNIASFIIQHRANTAFEENRFYSEAPLPTDLHIRYLEEFESDVKEMLG